MAFVRALTITGAAVSIGGTAFPGTSICASDAVAARLEELQFDPGEGPRWEAMRLRRPVLMARLRHDDTTRWPVFGQSLLELGVRALFVFPLTVGALDVGVVELYRSTPGALDPSERLRVVGLADQAAWELLARLLAVQDDRGIGAPVEHSFLSRREIHQATGMVLVQAGVGATEALLLLRAHAFVQGRPLREIAADVVARRLDFSPPRP
ncbi:GAF and ANTAR domain-containing protein [Specibacter cremeus]|uniref:GAF and ANTAR domain-containing protein n=1 Tax=Specibacter cremeus TaxID=1629051 RepID=UPI001F0C64A8|nr:GAF and ANTAR domain-containing protein [Specibacter cremeus]